MLVWVMFVIYAIISAVGLFMIKTGADSTSLGFDNGLFNIQMSPRLFIGFLLYLTSFLMSVYIMSRIKLSLFYPLSTGTILILTCFLGFFLLKEHIGIHQIIGMVLIVAGIFFINWN